MAIEFSFPWQEVWLESGSGSRSWALEDLEKWDTLYTFTHTLATRGACLGVCSWKERVPWPLCRQTDHHEGLWPHWQTGTGIIFSKKICIVRLHSLHLIICHYVCFRLWVLSSRRWRHCRSAGIHELCGTLTGHLRQSNLASTSTSSWSTCQRFVVLWVLNSYPDPALSMKWFGDWTNHCRVHVSFFGNGQRSSENFPYKTIAQYQMILTGGNTAIWFVDSKCDCQVSSTKIFNRSVVLRLKRNEATCILCYPSRVNLMVM